MDGKPTGSSILSGSLHITNNRSAGEEKKGGGSGKTYPSIYKFVLVSSCSRSILARKVSFPSVSSCSQPLREEAEVDEVGWGEGERA